MKKLLVTCVLALTILMAHRQSASAWSEVKFSAGVNLGWVGGGNRFLWGLYHSAPYPGGQDLGPFFPGIAAAANNGAYYGYPAAGAYPPAGYPVPAQAPAPHPAPAAGAMQYSYNPYTNSGYQPVGYEYSGYSASQVPSYWYGR